MSRFERKLTEDYPKVYKKWEGRVEVDGQKRTFWIQDLTKEYHDEVVHHYRTGFVADEPLCMYTDCANDPLCIDEFEEVWREALQMNISLVCLTAINNSKAKICGFNALAIATENEEIIEIKRPDSRRIFEFHGHVSKQKNVFEEFGIDKYLTAYGLYVLKEYRGEGIGQELLDARKFIAKEIGVKMSFTIYTSFISQKQAARAGFQDYVTVNYEDLEKTHKHISFPGIQKHTKECKFMYIIY